MRTVAGDSEVRSSPQLLVARETALVARLAIVIGAFQGQRPRHGLEGLGVASGVARLAAAPAGPARADMVRSGPR